MIAPSALCEILNSNGIEQYYGVPDSLLKDFCAYVDGNYNSDQHIICANEGNAVAMAIGHYMGTGKPAAVYMQNSGLGNAINPLVSLADPDVYSIPMLLLIGWRGEPSISDEPQHVKQGKITEQQLALLDIPYINVNGNTSVDSLVSEVVETMKNSARPVALLIGKNTFSQYAPPKNKRKRLTSLSREDAISSIFDNMLSDTIFVSTTGKTSREVFEVRQQRQESNNDFLTVGGMGHASSIAMAVANANLQKSVVVLDGDGAALMHLGAMTIIGQHSASNLIHIVLNNACHESVGGQPTVADNIDWEKIALGCGYAEYKKAWCSETLGEVLTQCAQREGPLLIEVVVMDGSRKDLGRPSNTPIENKIAFMQKIGSAQ